MFIHLCPRGSILRGVPSRVQTARLVLTSSVGFLGLSSFVHCPSLHACSVLVIPSFHTVPHLLLGRRYPGCLFFSLAFGGLRMSQLAAFALSPVRFDFVGRLPAQHSCRFACVPPCGALVTSFLLSSARRILCSLVSLSFADLLFFSPLIFLWLRCPMLSLLFLSVRFPRSPVFWFFLAFTLALGCSFGCRRRSIFDVAFWSPLVLALPVCFLLLTRRPLPLRLALPL